MSETPVFSTAAVAAPHPAVAETGLTILAAGGNAVEAAVAMAASAAAVRPRAAGLGGDGFWLVREPGGKVYALDASGPAGSQATIRRCRDKGFEAPPLEGPEACLTVAGAVGGWILALELARALGGRLPLDLLLGDAIRLARQGSGPVEPAVSAPGTGAPRPVPQAAEGALPVPAAPGAAPEAPPLSPMLADTLGQLAHAGLGDFYRGDVGREIAADLERLGSPVLRRDLEGHRARAVEPLAIRLRAATLFAPPPPSQGLAVLLAAGILDRMAVRRTEGADLQHALIEAVKRAYAVRDRVVADPWEVPQDPVSFFRAGWLEREAAAAAADRAGAFATPVPPQGRSLWIGCVDRDGLAVSCTHGLGPEGGSRSLLPATGILWHARGMGFSLDPGGWNPLEPGRRPFHALAPVLAAFDGGRVLAFGAGGAEEPQVEAQLFARHAQAGLSLAEALEAPRWALLPGEGGGPGILRIEAGFDPSLARELDRRGHRVEEEESGEVAGAFGEAGMLVKSPGDGRVAGAWDPRSGGAVLGL
ncbi:gamma-glutamyltransferase [Microvirga thermotolerans]|uniref:Gamma-glutamyltransferase n=1 Tax=Microvirga thermotolerans TaxID=2651334 RepID=A0A5P9JUD9_9HYPH|nr:gamma-glutamyltransferase [Microvirga thermotolerans]QFU15398.1 gamma-glutamyltransferase [Microvirga thermotolerans]